MTPTDSELERWSAERVMGFDIFAEDAPMPAYTWKEEDKIDRMMFVKDWHPLSDLNQCFMCVDKMREKGWDGKIDWYSAEEKVTPFHAEFWRWNPNVSASAFADTPARAIHLAMWRALEGK